ncbi:MAG: hypothetical protein WKG07_43410 [Hymenobacter sp.]
MAAKLERAATVAPADWLPRYYQAYALLINVFPKQGRRRCQGQNPRPGRGRAGPGPPAEGR